MAKSPWKKLNNYKKYKIQRNTYRFSKITFFLNLLAHKNIIEEILLENSNKNTALGSVALPWEEREKVVNKMNVYIIHGNKWPFCIFVTFNCDYITW